MICCLISGGNSYIICEFIASNAFWRSKYEDRRRTVTAVLHFAQVKNSLIVKLSRRENYIRANWDTNEISVYLTFWFRCTYIMVRSKVFHVTYVTSYVYYGMASRYRLQMMTGVSRMIFPWSSIFYFSLLTVSDLSKGHIILYWYYRFWSIISISRLPYVVRPGKPLRFPVHGLPCAVAGTPQVDNFHPTTWTCRVNSNPHSPLAAIDRLIEIYTRATHLRNKSMDRISSVAGMMIIGSKLNL